MNTTQETAKPTAPPLQEKTSIPKQDSGKVQRELDRMARQLEGISKNLKRLKDAV